jgi:hypothetical protein
MAAMEKNMSIMEKFFLKTNELGLDTTDTVQISLRYSTDFDVDDLVHSVSNIAHHLYWFEHPLLRSVVTNDVTFTQYRGFSDPNDIISVISFNITSDYTLQSLQNDVMSDRLDYTKCLFKIRIAIDVEHKLVTFLMSTAHLLFDADSGFYVLNNILELLGSDKPCEQVDMETAKRILDEPWNCHPDLKSIIKTQPSAYQQISTMFSLIGSAMYGSMFCKTRWPGPISLSEDMVTKLRDQSAWTSHPFKTIALPTLPDTFLENALNIARKHNVKLTALIHAVVIKSYFDTFPQANKYSIVVGGNINARRFYNTPRDNHIHLGCHSIGGGAYQASASQFDLSQRDRFWSTISNIYDNLYTDAKLNQAFTLSYMMNEAKYDESPRAVAKAEDNFIRGKIFPLNMIISNKGDLTRRIVREVTWRNISLQSRSCMSFYGNSFPFLSVASFDGAMSMQLVYRSYYLSDEDAASLMNHIHTNLMNFGSF